MLNCSSCRVQLQRSEGPAFDFWRRRAAELEALAGQWQKEYLESERTHVLRSQSEAAMKQEIAMLQSTATFVDRDLLYLRGVMVQVGKHSGFLNKACLKLQMRCL